MSWTSFTSFFRRRRKRGDAVTAPGGITGRFVGERHGVEWIAWQPAEFAPMCRAFDAAQRKSKGRFAE